MGYHLGFLITWAVISILILLMLACVPSTKTAGRSDVIGVIVSSGVAAVVFTLVFAGAAAIFF